MNVFKKINYANIAEHVDKLFDNDMNDMYVKNEHSGDSIDVYDENPDMIEDTGGDNDDKVNKYNEDKYDNEQMGQVISREDDEEGDQDYDMIAVDDE